VAEWYDQLVGAEGSEYHREVVHPGVLRLIAPTPDMHVLDVACGQGALCRLLATRAGEVTGVDASRELIAAARQHARRHACWRSKISIRLPRSSEV
jgi:2-polyprenyl-3-methyl-5-hydroxy-6-metoxy-1,4-benzoquinol methylase